MELEPGAGHSWSGAARAGRWALSGRRAGSTTLEDRRAEGLGVCSPVVTRGLSLPRHLRLGNTRPSGRAGDLDLRSTGLGRALGRGVRGRSQLSSQRT